MPSVLPLRLFTPPRPRRCSLASTVVLSSIVPGPPRVPSLLLLSPQAYFFRVLGLSHSSTLEQVQRRVEGVLEKFTGSVFGVPSGVGLVMQTAGGETSDADGYECAF